MMAWHKLEIIFWNFANGADKIFGQIPRVLIAANVATVYHGTGRGSFHNTLGTQIITAVMVRGMQQSFGKWA